MFIRSIVERIRGRKRREKVKVEIEELKKALLEDPRFRDEVLKELEYRTGRRDFLKISVLGLLGALGIAESVSSTSSPATPATTPTVSSNTAREIVSDYSGVKIPKPCTCIVAQDGTGDYDVSPGEDASEVIQKAIDYAHGKGGGEVIIREGKYVVKSAHLSIPSNIWLEGSGNVEFSIMWGGYFPKSSGYALITNSDYVNDYVNGNENIVIRNIRFVTDPNSWPIGKYGSRLFTFNNVENIIIEDCYFSTHCGGGELFIFGYNSKNIYIIRTFCIHNYLAKKVRVGDAILKVQAKSVTIRDCYVDGGSDNPNDLSQLGYNVNTVGGNTIIESCRARRCRATIWVEGDMTRNCRIINNDIRYFYGHGICISIGKNQLTEANCIVAYNYISNSISRFGRGVRVGGSTGVIVNNNIIGNCVFGITIDACYGCIVKGNILTNLSRAGITVSGCENIIESNKISKCIVGILIHNGKYYNVCIGGSYNFIEGNIINSKDKSIEEKYTKSFSGVVDHNIIVGNKIKNGKIITVGKNTISSNNYIIE